MQEKFKLFSIEKVEHCDLERLSSPRRENFIYIAKSVVIWFIRMIWASESMNLLGLWFVYVEVLLNHASYFAVKNMLTIFFSIKWQNFFSSSLTSYIGWGGNRWRLTYKSFFIFTFSFGVLNGFWRKKE